MPSSPFSLCRKISRSFGRWFATSVGRPMPRFTYEPSEMSRATRAAIWSRVSFCMTAPLRSGDLAEAGRPGRGARDANDALHEDARRDDRFRVELAERDDVVHRRDRGLRRHRHDRPEVARGLAVDQVAPAVAALGLDQGEVGVD